MAEMILNPGRHGSNRPEGPGVVLQLRGPLAIFAVIARKGRRDALAAAVRERFGLELPGPGLSAAQGQRALRWAGPEQWFALAETGDPAFGPELAAGLADMAAVVDQS